MTYLEPFEPKQENAIFTSRIKELYQYELVREPLFVLTEREAEAASPEAMAVCGEEDPGEGLEFLVTDFIEKP